MEKCRMEYLGQEGDCSFSGRCEWAKSRDKQDNTMRAKGYTKEEIEASVDAIKGYTCLFFNSKIFIADPNKSQSCKWQG